ncbi:MAG: hypothetical protein JWO58_60 [Chitinophagaceae bacterium]|nr:hypothetical protein [Chitinophagaceae bacterium]
MQKIIYSHFFFVRMRFKRVMGLQLKNKPSVALVKSIATEGRV